MASSEELISNTNIHREIILKKWQIREKIITPIGIDCYSSLLAKEISLSDCTYVPSIFGFRNLDANFFCNYLELMDAKNPWILPSQEMITIKYDLESRISLFEKNRSIHQLNTKLGLFLLNHDGGKYSRPYSQQLLTTVITDRLAFLELVTHTVFFKMIELEKIILVASGPAVLKEKITNSLRQNSRKFGVNFSLLFIKCESSKFGVEPPSASYSNGDLKLTFYPEHPFYGNVAQNWTLLREKTILLAKKMIKNNLTFNLSSL